jgi:hypothetical protein
MEELHLQPGEEIGNEIRRGKDRPRSELENFPDAPEKTLVVAEMVRSRTPSVEEPGRFAATRSDRLLKRTEDRQRVQM